MTPPRSFATRFDIPREVFRDAFWRAPLSRKIMAGYFDDVRKLADDLGLRPPIARKVWQLLRIDGEPSRYRSEPARRHNPPTARPAAAS